MAKKKVVTKKVKTSAFSRAKTRWNTFGSGRKVLSIVLLAAAGYCLLYIGQVIVQKIQFDAEKRSIHRVYENLVKEVGEPVVKKVISSCSYERRKFNNTRVCGTEATLVYRVDDRAHAQQIITDSTAQVSVVFDVDPAEKLDHTSLLELNSENRHSKIELTLISKEGTHRCYAKYIYAPSNSPFINISTDEDSLNLLVSLECSEDAKFEFFPVEE